MAASREIIAKTPLRAAYVRCQNALGVAGPPVRCSNHQLMRNKVIVQEPIVKRHSRQTSVTRSTSESSLTKVVQSSEPVVHQTRELMTSSVERLNTGACIKTSTKPVRTISSIRTRNVSIIPMIHNSADFHNEDNSEVCKTNSSTPEKLLDKPQKSFLPVSEELAVIHSNTQLKPILKETTTRASLINRIRNRANQGFQSPTDMPKRVLFAQHDVIFRL